MDTPMDAFEVGQFVIQVEPVAMDPEPVGGFFGSSLGATGTIQRHDRSYMDQPYRICAVELPFLVVEEVRPVYMGARRMLDTRRRKLRVLSAEFVAAFLVEKPK